MLHKIFTLCIKLGRPFCWGLNIYDLYEFLYRMWTPNEIILIIFITCWIPAIKAMVLARSFVTDRLKIRIGKDKLAFLLRLVYWLMVAISVFNLSCKLTHGYDGEALVVLTIIYAFALILDYRETEENIRKF